MEKELNYVGRLKEEKNYFHKVYLQRTLGLSFLSLMIGMLPSFWHRKGIFHMRVVISCFQEEMGRSECFLVSAISQVPLAPSSPYLGPKWHILGGKGGSRD